MRWRAGMAVYWRAPGSSQVGVEHPVVLTGLSRDEQELLEHVAAHPEDPLEAVAKGRGWSPARLRALLGRLPAHLLIEDDADLALVAPPDAAAWSRWAGAGVERPRDRTRAAVGIDGLDAVGLQLAWTLAEGGVGELYLGDEGVVRPGDVRAGGYRGCEVGSPRAPAAFDLLRRSFPQLPISAARSSVGPGRADLVVIVDHGVSDPLRYRRHLAADQPHLAVVVRDLTVAVGPLVQPGSGPCLRCVELARTDADDRWPVVATQLRAGGPHPRETASATVAAGLAAHQALAFLDGRPVALVGATLLVDAVHPVPRVETWPVHPACGCAPETLAVSGAHAGGQRGSV